KAAVVKLTRSISSIGGRLRLSSVKKLNMPPPMRAPGKALRAARNIFAAGGAGGHTLPGSVLLRSDVGERSTVAKGEPIAAAAAPSASISSTKPSTVV